MQYDIKPKERPILLNAEMVRAVLDGRKTQTRRIMSPQPADDICTHVFPNKEIQGWLSSLKHAHGSTTAHFCPFGQPGDRLWVRETWSVVSHAFDDDGLMIDYLPERPAKAVHEKPFGNGYYSGHAIYAADGGFTWGDDDGCVDGRSYWKPSIHMPRWASRITLEITGVRVERLQGISEQDAAVEGVIPAAGGVEKGWEHRFNFRELWMGIYGADSWQANPFVWVVEFKRVEDEHA